MTIPAVYKKNREWSDKLIPLVIQILAKHFITIAPDEMDINMGTDLVIHAKNVSVRLRKAEYKKYNDFTIRISHAQHGMTEYDKWRSSSAPDVLFYGYIDESGPELTINPAYLVDVFRWRIALTQGLINDKKRTYQKDGTAFVSFPFHESYTMVINE